MPKLFGVDIAKEIASAMGPGLLPATLITVASITPSSGTLTEGSTSEKKSSCRGVIEDYSNSQIDGTIVLRGDRKVLLLGGTLPNNVVPDVNDNLEIEGKRFTIIRVQRDPAAASYECQVRV